MLGIYLLGSWFVYEVVQGLTQGLGLPEWFPALAVVLLLIGLPIVVATAFVQQGAPGRAPPPVSITAMDELYPVAGPTVSSRIFTWNKAIMGGVGAFALLGFVGTGWVMFGGRPAGPAGSATGSIEQSVAVLPFVNMSGNPENEYFSDGITEALLNALAQVPGLRVPARTSSFAFKGQNIPIAEIAETLAVANILEGSVRRQGERVLITAQLVDAETDTHLWSDEFERELDDVFAIQREIATAIADQLEVALVGGQRETLVVVATENPEAYDLYLRGREYWDRPNWERPNFEAAIDLFGRAVALDPDFALARAALSVAHSAMTWGGYGGYDQSPERLAAATEEAEQALRLQPDLPEAHLAMRYVHYWGNYDLSRGLEEFETAQQLLPNHVEIMEARGFVHRRLGDWPEVYAIFKEATALDPYDADLFQNIGGLTFLNTGRHEDAVRALTRAVELAPDQLLWQVQLGRAYLFGEGQLDSLRATVARLPTDESTEGVRRQLALFDRDSEQMLQLLQDSDVPNPLYAAWAHRFRGDEVAARVAFDSARVRFERLTQEQPDDR